MTKAPNPSERWEKDCLTSCREDRRCENRRLKKTLQNPQGKQVFEADRIGNHLKTIAFAKIILILKDPPVGQQKHREAGRSYASTQVFPCKNLGCEQETVQTDLESFCEEARMGPFDNAVCGRAMNTKFS